MERICLDSEVALGFLRGERAIVEKLQYYANREEICIDALTAIELGTMIRKRDVMEEFLASVNILPVDRKTSKITTQLLRDEKRRLAISTVITAAVCLSHQAFLFTKDRAPFEGIRGLRLV